ncbi:MAG: DUF4833 domain-containing protein [Bacteroidota bacterium]|nr:DUF4833 domain-containing protein [Bacteroidota bacterium]
MKRMFFSGFISILISLVLIEFQFPFSDHILFNIGRSINADEINYYVNQKKDGTLNEKEPISIFWIKRTADNRLEPITWIQENFSYGLEFITTTSVSAKFQFVSYGKRTFELKKNTKGDYSVFTISGNKEVEVKRIFVQIDGGTFWFPKITKVELHANIAGTNNRVIEIINP